MSKVEQLQAALRLAYVYAEGLYEDEDVDSRIVQHIIWDIDGAQYYCEQLAAEKVYD